MKCRSCKMDIPNGATVCPYCRMGQKRAGDLSCSGMLGALCCVVACFFALSMCSREPEKDSNTNSPAPTTTTAHLLSFAEQDKLVETLQNITKTTFGKNVSVIYDHIANRYNVRVWRESFAEFVNAENPDEWEKAIEQAISAEKILNQTIAEKDPTASLTFSYSSDEEGNNCLLTIHGGSVDYDARNPNPPETTSAETTTPPTEDSDVIQLNEHFVLSGLETEKTFLSSTITGIVTNVSDTDYSYVSISFALYDENGNKLEDAIDIVSGLKPGESWKFKAIGTTEATRMELSDFNAF